MKRTLLITFLKTAFICLTGFLLHQPLQAQGCWKLIAKGSSANYTVAIAQDGSLWAWGYNSTGQLGDGTTTDRNTPVKIGTATNWKTLAVGRYHTIATKTDGSLWVWGENYYGQLGDGTTVAYRTSPIQIGTATNWLTVAAGVYHSIATKTDGTLWAWGRNDYGQLGDGTATAFRNSPVQIGNANNWLTTAAGQYHTIATKTDGSLWAWGNNSFGQLGDGSTTDKNNPVQIGTAINWQIITPANSYTMGTKIDGSLWAWGYNDFGQLGDGTTTQRKSPVQIGVATNWKTVAAGYFQTIAIKTDGSLWAWGGNNYGQLGDGTITTNVSPAKIGTASNWQTIAAGQNHTVATKTDGSLWAWGNNGFGQLGDGTTTQRNIPTAIACPSVLPLTYTYFTSTPQNNSVLTQWQTTNEINVSHLNVQRSIDGVHFTTVGTVTATGGGEYRFTDMSLPENAAVLYYRLESVDKDAAKQYSKVVTVNITSNRSNLSVYPNPVATTLHAKFVAAKAETVITQITDMQGRILQQVQRSVAAGNNNLPVTTSALVKGSYILVIKGTNTQQVQFVKE